MDRRTTRRGGFTLVELIIAAAVTSVILSAIAALFVLALRTVKSGNAAMDANELTRAAFAVMERDLNAAFTSREHGELFHFHGNEVGMSFIGLSRTYDSTTNNEVVQLGRVTYVINPSLNRGSNGIDDDNDGEIDEADEGFNDLIRMEWLDIEDLDTNGKDDDGDGTVDEPGEGNDVQTNGIDDDGNGFIDEPGEGRDKEMVDAILPGETDPGVRTVSLLRYFEPGIETLDQFDPFIVAAFESSSPENLNMQAALTDALDALDLDNVRDAHIISDVTRNFRRDAYIRMLADAAILDPLNGDYPNGWALLEPGPDGEPRNPYDYVIAENILDLESQTILAGGDPTPFIIDEIQRLPYFLYGRIALNASSQTNVEYATTWNANKNIFEILDNVEWTPETGAIVVADLNPWQTFGGIGTPLQARLPEIVRVRLPFVFDSPYAGAPHLQRELAQDIRVPSAFTRRNPLAGL